MKCIKNVSTGLIHRVSDEEAAARVAKGLDTYCSKREWKDQKNPKPQPKVEAKVEKKAKKGKKTDEIKVKAETPVTPIDVVVPEGPVADEEPKPAKKARKPRTKKVSVQ